MINSHNCTSNKRLSDLHSK
ncbi:hypothetical protein CGLO_18070 [Colletotrichum gloeosporioides Cg-14]|uniref:Uncharacterized protein n=1 Tax=Colletotrichum gloeosporioides (strain Cg-14) TaxID=1237896 RepID=T0JS34_COLGC|nr:hypothetical protein CGLO_18070 [Colletotrichum gloeosporioides Cg-14]